MAIIDGSRRDRNASFRSFRQPHTMSSAALELLHHRRNVARIVLEIAVGGDDEAAAGVIEARRERRGLTEVAAEPDHPQARVGRLQPRENLEALVRAPIVDDDDFVRTGPRR